MPAKPIAGNGAGAAIPSSSPHRDKHPLLLPPSAHVRLLYYRFVTAQNPGCVEVQPRSARITSTYEDDHISAMSTAKAAIQGGGNHLGSQVPSAADLTASMSMDCRQHESLVR